MHFEGDLELVGDRNVQSHPHSLVGAVLTSRGMAILHLVRLLFELGNGTHYLWQTGLQSSVVCVAPLDAPNTATPKCTRKTGNPEELVH